MKTRFCVGMARLVLAVGVVVLVGSQSAYAGVYVGNKCVADKQKEAGKYCKSVLRAWSKWDKGGGSSPENDAKRDGLMATASDKLASKWTKAEDKASLKGVDCADTTLSPGQLAAFIDPAAAAIANAINADLDLGNKNDAKCGSKLLNAAAVKCLKMLLAESKYVKKLERDPAGLKRDESQQKASNKFGLLWNKFSTDCPTTATEAGIESDVDALVDQVVFETTVSPNVPDDAFMAITHPPGGDANNPVSYQGDTLLPQCQDASAYTFFAKRGSENKLLMYYYGGGACWDSLTCGAATCTQSVGTTPPGLAGSGFADLANPENPFKDWHVVQVPYCSCDVHWGDKAVDYLAEFIFPEKHVEHRGYANAKLAEKWAREHFVNPTDIFVTGSSAGSYGAIMAGIFLNEVYPGSSINVMGDGGNGVITSTFLEQNFENWGAAQHLPDVPGIADVPVANQSIPSIFTAAASFYPRANWSSYTTAFDGGGGGQTGFYNVMVVQEAGGGPLDILAAQANWHEASCQFNGLMRQQAFATANAVALENDNYRYYVASGSRHTGFGNPRVYDDTTGGVPTLVDWVNAMIADDPSWVNVEADPFNVLFPGECSGGSDNPGDPCGFNSDCPNGSCLGEDVRPNPLAAPFEISGDDTIVNCSPSGAFLDLEGGVLE